MSAYRSCSSCGRQILEELFDTPTAHGVGCSIRRSLLGKAAYKKKEKRLERARKAAATRAAKRAAGI